MEENNEKNPTEVETKVNDVKEEKVVNNGKEKKEATPKSYAIAALVCSLAGLLVAGAPLGGAAIASGVMALKGKPEEMYIKIMAIAGLILGAFDFISVMVQITNG